MGAHLFVTVEGNECVKRDHFQHDEFDKLVIRLDKLGSALANDGDGLFDRYRLARPSIDECLSYYFPSGPSGHIVIWNIHVPKPNNPTKRTSREACATGPFSARNGQRLSRGTLGDGCELIYQ